MLFQRCRYCLNGNFKYIFLADICFIQLTGFISNADLQSVLKACIFTKIPIFTFLHQFWAEVPSLQNANTEEYYSVTLSSSTVMLGEATVRVSSWVYQDQPQGGQTCNSNWKEMTASGRRVPVLSLFKQQKNILSHPHKPQVCEGYWGHKIT